MHAAYRRSSNRQDAKAFYHARFPDIAGEAAAGPRPEPEVEALARSVYGERTGPNWPAILAILGAHVLLLVVLVRADVIHVTKARPAPIVVDLISIAPPPPAEVPDKPAPPVKTPAAIVAPAPVVRTLAAASSPVLVTPDPPPPAVVAVAAAPAPLAPQTVTAAGDLSSTRIAGDPPRYPIESRRKHEQGVVTLGLTLATDGSVAQIVVSKSSGFARLDKAALDAVRHWRWKPMLRAGQPVMVRALLDIPFVLK